MVLQTSIINLNLISPVCQYDATCLPPAYLATACPLYKITGRTQYSTAGLRLIYYNLKKYLPVREVIWLHTRLARAMTQGMCQVVPTRLGIDQPTSQPPSTATQEDLHWTDCLLQSL